MTDTKQAELLDYVRRWYGTHHVDNTEKRLVMVVLDALAQVEAERDEYKHKYETLANMPPSSSDGEGLTTPENSAEAAMPQEEAETSGTISWEQAMTQASGKAAAERILAAMEDVITNKLEGTPFSNMEPQRVLTQKNITKIAIDIFVFRGASEGAYIKRFLDDCYKANKVFFEQWAEVEEKFAKAEAESEESVA